jgi:hypothetical protein
MRIGARRTPLLAERTIMNASKSPAKIRAGILGVGNWARYDHIPALRLLPEYEIVAVSSRHEETASAIAREFFIPHNGCVVLDGKLVTGQNQFSASDYGILLFHMMAGKTPVVTFDGVTERSPKLVSRAS